MDHLPPPPPPVSAHGQHGQGNTAEGSLHYLFDIGFANGGVDGTGGYPGSSTATSVISDLKAIKIPYMS